MRNIRMRRLGSTTFSWAEDIAGLLGVATLPDRTAAVVLPLPVAAV